ncbi:YOS1 family protein [Aspergillus aculeatinus CBS 121060]|uniref:Uncharacterized protein n=1 Tax=Aspergillus aculeatinus CBS 121060 TaxID=1448322 RepID=A0ACD1HF96_9EURO|nr:hypothetical protein BO66DRAFT_390257 [Aspergillus aculeatinus CBS 121060]RAH72137.1 hypothetical protein BO66DRAFT_390257 [Aspergillus aculeatinus CBS 121060]
MFFFGLGKLFYVVILFINSLAILSEDRFLARSTSTQVQVPSGTSQRSILPPPLSPWDLLSKLTKLPPPQTVGWGRMQADPAFGATYDNTSVKAKTINLIASVRTVMRSTSFSQKKKAQATHEHTSLAQTPHLPHYTASHNNQTNLYHFPLSPTEKRGICITVPLIVINTIVIIYELILG